MQSHIRKVYACFAVTCHLHFWQNDRDLLRATAVTWGWNGYQNKSQHRKLTLEKKILPPLSLSLSLLTFGVVLLQAAHTFCVSVLYVHVGFDDKHVLMHVQACVHDLALKKIKKISLLTCFSVYWCPFQNGLYKCTCTQHTVAHCILS